MTNKNAPTTNSSESAPSKRNYNRPRKFIGTDNPRHLRVLQALLVRPMPREQLGKVAGCSNGPDLIAELRRRGLEVPCERIKFIDRALLYRWLAQRGRAAL